MTRRSLFLTSLLIFSSLSIVVQGATIAVPNHFFENDVLLTDDGLISGAAGWVAVFDANTHNPTASAFTGAGGRGTPMGGDGPQSSFLANNSALQSASSLGTILSGATYTLVIAIGDAADGGNAGEPGILRLGFLIGDAFVSGGDTSFAGSNYSPEGTFRDFTFQYTAQPGDAGKSLKIFLGHSSEGPSVHYDNARLSTNVPEPTSALLVFVGVALYCSRRPYLRGITTAPPMRRDAVRRG
jgi:hypothetical protein